MRDRRGMGFVPQLYSRGRVAPVATRAAGSGGKKPAKRTVFDHEVRDQPRAAVIGGGFSGLSFARQFNELGGNAVVFDTGEHGVGGRLGTRSSQDRSFRSNFGKDVIFDHAAQFFTVSDPSFAAQVDIWSKEGVIGSWDAPAFLVRSDTSRTVLEMGVKYFATRGMRHLAEHMTTDIEVRRPIWVSDMVPTKEGWVLKGRGKNLGTFDYVVIAHNGKCANRLTRPAGVPEIHAQLKRLRLSANYVLMVAFEEPLSEEAECIFFDDKDDILSFAANNTRKLVREDSKFADCWTLISTNNYGRRHKVPQERIPKDVQDAVTREMLDSFSKLLGLSTLTPASAKLQLWGAALPLNSPRVGHIYDDRGRVGICGDWLMGKSMQAAWVSGRLLARRMMTTRGEKSGHLDSKFETISNATTIGEFPS